MADIVEKADFADGGATKDEKSTNATDSKEDGTRSSKVESNDTEQGGEKESRSDRSHYSKKRKYGDDDDDRRSRHKDHQRKRGDGKWERGGRGGGRGNKRGYGDRYEKDDGERREYPAYYDHYAGDGEAKRGPTDRYMPGGNNNYRQKKQRVIRSSYEDLPESDDHDEIRRQVEFYFSDSNLPVDKFLLELTGGHENKGVDLKALHDFKRMRRFQPFSTVVAAIKESKFLDLDDQNMVTRKVPLDEKFTDSPFKNRALLHDDETPRSIYAKGFGEETKTTQTDIEEFFEPYGPINAIRLRRAREDGLFKGSVFVEFKDIETQMKFLALDVPKFDGNELKIMSKADYEASQKQRMEKEKVEQDEKAVSKEVDGGDKVEEAAKDDEVDGGVKVAEDGPAKEAEEEAKEEQSKGEEDSKVDGNVVEEKSET